MYGVRLDFSTPALPHPCIAPPLHCPTPAIAPPLHRPTLLPQNSPSQGRCMGTSSRSPATLSYSTLPNRFALRLDCPTPALPHPCIAPPLRLPHSCIASPCFHRTALRRVGAWVLAPALPPSCSPATLSYSTLPNRPTEIAPPLHSPTPALPHPCDCPTAAIAPPLHRFTLLPQNNPSQGRCMGTSSRSLATLSYSTLPNRPTRLDCPTPALPTPALPHPCIAPPLRLTPPCIASLCVHRTTLCRVGAWVL